VPTVELNKQKWNGGYDWAVKGDEWSRAWGGTTMQWYGTILPRIQRFLPAGRILEIACGYGRWSEFLRRECESLVAVDLSEECVKACQERFAGIPRMEFHVNDGRSLDMVAASSIDFVFTFDSLVHVEPNVLEAYIAQMPRVLRQNGAAFLHHSNLGRYRIFYARMRHFQTFRPLLVKLGILERNLHWRDWRVSAEIVREMVVRHGLKCFNQEIIPWGTRRARIDCLTTIVRSDSDASKPRIFENADFMSEAKYLSRLAPYYTGQLHHESSERSA
jgi:ubiquinone/menaquinone biosynthesis C-methylase UbiE